MAREHPLPISSDNLTPDQRDTALALQYGNLRQGENIYAVLSKTPEVARYARANWMSLLAGQYFPDEIVAYQDTKDAKGNIQSRVIVAHAKTEEGLLAPLEALGLSESKGDVTVERTVDPILQTMRAIRLSGEEERELGLR